MLGFLKQKQVDYAFKRKQEIQIRLDRFNAAFLVQNVFKVKGQGTAFAGKVLRGKIKTGQNIYFSGTWGKVEAIEGLNKSLAEAEEGSSVAITVSGIETPIERGALLHLK